MSSAELIASDLHKSIDGRPILGGINLSVRRGEIAALLGPTGSGKSTCFNVLMGIVRPDRGQVTLFGRDVTGLGIDGRARLGLGYVPQAPELFETMSVRNNLRIALEARVGDDREVAGFLDRLLAHFGLDPVRDRMISVLSGGQRRLVEIAYAVCTLPKFLLLDEPFAGLDPIVVERIAAIIRTLARGGMGILLTDHKAHLALDLASRALVIADGRMVAEGPSAMIACHPEVRQVFLGESGPLPEYLPNGWTHAGAPAGAAQQHHRAGEKGRANATAP
jgi:lipopolysaccharide export system ATP-binding protein